MRSFSIRGISTKGFYGPNATSLGTGTDGHGNALTYGSGNSSGGNAGGQTANLIINQDFIDIDGSNGAGLFLSQLMTNQQQTDYQNGLITTLNITGGGVPARGYWVISGFSPPAPPTGIPVGQAEAGFLFDLDAPIDVTVNLNSFILRIYGGAGSGASVNPLSVPTGQGGGDAIVLSGGASTLSLFITNQSGADIGRIIGGGGGGGGGNGNLGNPQSPCGGGGGAGGWFFGSGGLANGGSLNNTPGQNGGVYDANNGGADNPAVTGGAGGAVGGTGAAAGGGLASNGSSSTTSGGLGGFAVNRSGQPGVTTIVSGGGPTNIIGTAQ